MARVTDEEVEGILGFNYATISQPSLTPFINTASNIVDRLVTDAALEEYDTIPANTLALIELWLSGYFYMLMDAPYKRKQTDKASGEFVRGQEDYKNAAIALDPTGLLIGILSKWPTVSGGWLGKTDVEALDYSQRMGAGSE